MEWETKKLPESCSLDDCCNPYYLVRLEGFGCTMAMYINNSWWQNYYSKIMVPVTGWVALKDES